MAATAAVVAAKRKKMGEEDERKLTLLVTWGEDWFGEDGRDGRAQGHRRIVHDYMYSRLTGKPRLIEELLDDI